MTKANQIANAIVRHVRGGTVGARVRLSWVNWQERRCRAWFQSQASRRASMDIDLLPGTKMRLYFDDLLSEYIYCGNFERAERTLVERTLRPGDTFIDVGANIGLYTLTAARAVGESGHVYAFEPSSATYRRLIDNIRLNQYAHVDAFQEALSDRIETRSLSIFAEGQMAWNSLATATAAQAHDVIHCTTFDTFVGEHPQAGKATLVKIDVEGWEYFVLEGGARTLSGDASPDLLVEFNDEHAKAAGKSCAELYDRLIALGYETYRFSLTPRPHLWRVDLQTLGYDTNVLATRSVERVSQRSGFAILRQSS